MLQVFKGTVTAYVNGLKYDGDLTNDSDERSHQQIVLEVGSAARPAAELHLSSGARNEASAAPI